jgi:hypothetical protein
MQLPQAVHECSIGTRRRCNMAHDSPRLGAWQAVPPNEAAQFLSSVRVPWWVAGGWALDLFLVTTSRPHVDIDVGVLRRDAHEVLGALSSWEFFEARSGVLTQLTARQRPHANVNSLWCRPTSTSPWTLEVMLDDSDADGWVFRRQPAIRRPLSDVIRRTSEGLPYLAPEIQLLYKAKRPRERDHADFSRTAPCLDLEARQWLFNALVLTHPGHQWISALD